MSHKFFKTIKTHITIITVSFTLIITVLIAFISFYIFQSYARKNLIQSTEFNLQLISGVISQDVSSLDMLSRWCCYNNQIVSYLSDPNASAREVLAAYQRFNEEYQNNRARDYIQRLIITDASHSRIFQVGGGATNSNPVTVYNIDELFKNRKDQVSAWEKIERDPYEWKNSTSPDIITVFRPILHPTTRKVIGYVYLAASTNLVTDQLSNYRVAEDSSLFITLGSQNYEIKGNTFTKMDTSFTKNATAESAATLDSKTQVQEVRLKNGGTGTVISYPVRNTSISLSNSLSQQQLSLQRTVFLRILLLISASILFLGAFITALLNHLINAPVGRLRRRMDQIARGDFSADPKIEWDNELGDVGRGINKLSLNVSALMETRIADEKKKKDLEYRMLQSQVNPHFLYNTLNSIKWMATIQNATGIAEMTTSLSRLLKSIAKGSQKVIPLRDELSLLDDYFLIQQYRYGGSITLRKELDDGVSDNAIPRFTLQPLLENAIFHGIEPKGGAGTIRIITRLRDENTVEIMIEDDGVGMDEGAIQKIFSGENDAPSGMFQQIGILNVHKRIQYEFGEQYGLTITSNPGEFTRTAIFLPRRPLTM